MVPGQLRLVGQGRVKVLVTGAAGQLGRELVSVGGDVTGLTRAELDVSDRAAVRRVGVAAVFVSLLTPPLPWRCRSRLPKHAWLSLRGPAMLSWRRQKTRGLCPPTPASESVRRRYLVRWSRCLLRRRGRRQRSPFRAASSQKKNTRYASCEYSSAKCSMCCAKNGGTVALPAQSMPKRFLTTTISSPGPWTCSP